MTDSGDGTYTYTHTFAHRKGIVNAYARKLTNNKFVVSSPDCYGSCSMDEVTGVETEVVYDGVGVDNDPSKLTVIGVLFSEVAGNFNLYYEGNN